MDRVTSVTSSADIFNFQTPAAADTASNGIAPTGVNSGVYMAPDYAQGLGSDESLGGALLTPIPWLNNTSFDGDDEHGDTNVLGESTFIHRLALGFFQLTFLASHRRTTTCPASAGRKYRYNAYFVI